MKKLKICQFYNGLNVLITGGTGFMGKILIEKLLRSTDVSTIYLLIREKKGKNMHSRLAEIFDNVIFERVKNERPKYRHRVVALAGDCSVSGLGLTIEDRQLLISRVNVVFHMAATVRFDENIKLAFSINVKGTQDIIELCHQMKQLKSIVHVSTAFSNCHLNEVDERFYDYSCSYEKIETALEKLTEFEADKLTPRLIGKWPNTYTFTKALAESLIRNTSNGLPIGIFRPSIIISTYSEPIKSWIDNFYGPTAACAASLCGIMRVMHLRKDAIADLVPVDTCVAALIACGWDTYTKSSWQQDRAAFIPPIYNYVSSVENPLTWQEFHILYKLDSKLYPFSTAIWSIDLKLISQRQLYVFLRFLFHHMFGLLIDTGAVLTGHKPRLLKMYGKIHKFTNVTAFFGLREWKFHNNNVQKMWKDMSNEDQEAFPFSMRQVSWLLYFKGYIRGIRVYLMNDPEATLERARSRMRMMDACHEVVKFLIKLLGFGLVWYVGIKVMGIKVAFISPSVAEAIKPGNNSIQFL